MKFKKIFNIMKNALCGILHGFETPASPTGKTPARADGTFIQLDMTYLWDDAMWQSEFNYLKEAGMHYLIVMGAALTSGNETKTVYPTKLKECKMHTKTDIIDLCFSNAQKAGIKVFLGINFNDLWWKITVSDPEWLYAQMSKDNLIADELFKRYHNKYPEAFYGWYWVYEVDNVNFRTRKQFAVLSTAINIQLQFLKNKNERLPFLISPFMNFLFSCPKKYAEGWAYVFEHTDFENGDIFCPQDSVGAGGVDIEDVFKWFAAFRKVIDKKCRLKLWSNAECFDQRDWSSAPVGRFIKQMEIEAPYVENIITFAYSHYYSPNNIDKGYHKTYINYLKTGKLDDCKPSPPSNIAVTKIEKNKYQITWGAARDNIGVCGYQVYRNNRPVFKTEVQRRYGGNSQGPVLSYTDVLKGLDNLGCTKVHYEVRAFDYAGNVSDPASILIPRK